MPDTRAIITELLEKSGQSASWLSLQIGQKRGYLHDFFAKGSPADLSYEQKVKVAEVLGVDPRKLGVVPMAEQGPVVLAAFGFSDDAVRYEPGPDTPLRDLDHVMHLRMVSIALDQHERRVRPGSILVFDLNKSRQADIATGTIVYVTRANKSNLGTSGTIRPAKFMPRPAAPAFRARKATWWKPSAPSTAT